jgi:hypothetical protein
MDPQTGTTADSGYSIYVNANGRLVASATGEIRSISLIR